MFGEKVNYSVKTIVLQPTTFCNINCSYCYLPDRDKQLKMSPEITRKLSHDIIQEKRYVNVLWHGGEPMAVGLKNFSQLFEPFLGNEYVTHIIQTNATSIDDNWCTFFKSNNFHVGVSIDGPEWANLNRVDRKGKETFNRTIQGIQTLQTNDIDFVVIAVVDFNTINKGKDLYNFFCDLGCRWVGINLEEIECVNQREICDDERVSQFWGDIFQSWYQNPMIEVREISSALSWFDDLNKNQQFTLDSYHIDLLTTIAYDGDIVLLSPELLGGKSLEYNDFIVGNITRQSVFEVETMAINVQYVKDFSKGVLMCQEECDYFSFCRGGQASNKFYETGSLLTTETKYCRNSKKRVVDAIMNQLNFQ
jgi:uncharacterized protein